MLLFLLSQPFPFLIPWLPDESRQIVFTTFLAHVRDTQALNLAERYQSAILENLHDSLNAMATMLFSLLLFTSLGTSAIVTQHRLPITRVVDNAPSLITPAPVIDYHAIFARDSVPTCGYVSGKAGEHCYFDSSGSVLMWNGRSFSLNMPFFLHVHFDFAQFCRKLGVLWPNSMHGQLQPVPGLRWECMHESWRRRMLPHIHVDLEMVSLRKCW